MCTHLAKRGATYYFRRVIPDELRPAMGGKAEFMRSLRTKDREEAKRRIPAHTLESERLLDEAKARLGSPAASRAAPAPATWTPTEREIEQLEWERREEGEREARQDARAHLLARLEAATTKTTAQLEPWEAAAMDLLRNRRAEWTLEQERQLIRRVKRSERLHGVPAPNGEAASQSRTDAPQSAPETVAQGTMLETDVVDGWAAERRPKQKTIDAHRAVARWFNERIGRIPVDQLTRKDVLAFKTRLLEDGQTPVNIGVKLQRLSTLLQWAADNGHAENNPAKGVTIRDTDADRNKRRPYDLASLNKLFGSPVFTEGQRPARGKGEAAYWLPLLALFTGARLEELGQLRPKDVQLEQYPNENGEDRDGWFIHIREDADDDLKLKNAASERVVPVHPELARLGFLSFVEAANEAKQARLFPALKPDKYGRLTAKWGDWFSDYRRNVAMVTDRRITFHSFRHTFKDYARHATILEDVQRQIMGHSPGDVADDYGSGYSRHQLVEGMKLYRVPGLKLPV